jgi:hypothetical protein
MCWWCMTEAQGTNNGKLFNNANQLLPVKWHDDDEQWQGKKHVEVVAAYLIICVEGLNKITDLPT